MADNIWDNSDADNDGNVAANWSLNRVPTGTDVMVFDSGTTNANCTFSGPVSCAGLAFANTYTGIVNFNGQAMTFGASGLICINGGSATVNCSNSIITCSGNFNNKDIGTWVYGTSTVVMDGNGTTITSGSTKDLYKLTISADVELVTADRLDLRNNLVVDVGKTFTLSQKLLFQSGTLSAAGAIDGTGTLELGSGRVVDDVSGGITCALLIINATTAGLIAGEYGSAEVLFKNVFATAKLIIFQAGTYTFTGNVTFDATTAGNLNINLATNDASLVFQGNVTLQETGAGAVVWSKPATGTISFEGTTEYSDNTAAIQVLGDVEVDGTSLKLLTEMECDDFDGISGAFDINGQTLDINGNMNWANGFIISDPAGGTFEVGGNFIADAQDISGATAEWFLNVTGTAVASGVGDVANSNADGGTEITANAGPWADSGGNSNWFFGEVSPNLTNKNNYNGYLAFIQQYIKHKINGTTPWKNPQGDLI